MIPVDTFAAHLDCRSCALWEGRKTPGIPARLLSSDPSHTSAILFVGEAPGLHEDTEGKCWIGAAGQLLHKFITASGLDKLADIYLSNAIRCRLSQKANPTTGQLNKCRPHLQADLDLIASRGYESIYIFCQGRYAFQAVTTLSSLEGKAFKLQARSLSYFVDTAKNPKRAGLTPPPNYPHPIRVLTTYHPAALLPGAGPHDKSPRSPFRVIAVQDHFSLLVRLLTCPDTSTFLDPSLADLDIHVDEPMPRLDSEPVRLILDIETYGILKGKDQTEFHPTRSLHIDGVPYAKQIVSVTFLYYDPAGKPHAYYYASPLIHSFVSGWLEYAASHHIPVVGQNIKFDVAYLRARHTLYRYWLDPRRITLDDTLLWSFLAYEHRPERSLKNLSYLFGIYDYSNEKVVGGGEQAQSPKDPNLVKYNVIDCRNTEELFRHYQEQIAKQYGAGSAKFSRICACMRNWILWDVIMLEENGIGLSLTYLEKLRERKERQCHRLRVWAERLEFVLTGSGSETSKRHLLHGIFESHQMLNSRSVLYTDKTKLLGIGIENLNLAKLTVPRSSKEGQLLRVWARFSEYSKLLSSYILPLLTVPAKGVQYRCRDNPRVGVTHPYWFPMPSEFGKADDSGKVGGQKQGRFSAQKPGEPTFPAVIKKAVTSRFPGGKVQRWDMSQIELRVLAFMSGDHVMQEEYFKAVDRHRGTALIFFPTLDPTDPGLKGHGKYRQAGKTGNFLIVYRGGAETLANTIMRDLGLEVNILDMKAAIERLDAKYWEMRQWQDGVVEFVRKHGYWELPTGWSRFWGMGECINGKISEIADFPIQTIAAQLLQSSMFAINCDLKERRLRSYIIDNIYDSLAIDTCPGEEKIVDEIVDKHLTTPPLWPMLLEVIGQDRRIPLLYEKEK